MKRSHCRVHGPVQQDQMMVEGDVTDPDEPEWTEGREMF